MTETATKSGKPNDFVLAKPCKSCPFRSDVRPFLHIARVLGIIKAPAFACHNTVEYGEEGDANVVERSKQCAGRAIMLMRDGVPDTFMQASMRLNVSDWTKLDMANPNVYRSRVECVAAYIVANEGLRPLDAIVKAERLLEGDRYVMPNRREP